MKICRLCLLLLAAALLPAGISGCAADGGNAVETPAAAETVEFRCAYWKRPADAPELFVLSGGKFVHCEMLELSFAQVLRPNLNADGTITVYKKSGDGHEPLLRIDARGLKKFGAVVLPGFDPAAPEPERIQIFDLDETAFPFGSIQVVNWTKRPLSGKLGLSVRGEAAAENPPLEFPLPQGGRFVSDVIPDESNVCDVRFFGETGKGIFSSGLKLHRSRRAVLFVLETGEGTRRARLVFRNCLFY